MKSSFMALHPGGNFLFSTSKIKVPQAVAGRDGRVYKPRGRAPPRSCLNCFWKKIGISNNCGGYSPLLQKRLKFIAEVFGAERRIASHIREYNKTLPREYTSSIFFLQYFFLSLGSFTESNSSSAYSLSSTLSFSSLLIFPPAKNRFKRF